MKLVTHGDTRLIASANLLHHRIESTSYVQLIINTRDKWPSWRDIGTSIMCLGDYPNQLAAIAIDGIKEDVVLVVVPANPVDTHLLANTVRYFCLEKDQLSIVFLPYVLLSEPTTVLASYMPATQ